MVTKSRLHLTGKKHGESLAMDAVRTDSGDCEGADRRRLGSGLSTEMVGRTVIYLI